jgi:hypothetical protein
MKNIIVLKKLEEMISENQDLTFGEILYSIFRNTNSKLGRNDFVFKIRALENNTIYTFIENAIEKEEK